MRNRTLGALLAIAACFPGCGIATVRMDGGDAGQVFATTGNPGGMRRPDGGNPDSPDGGDVAPASLSGQVTLLGSPSNGGAQVTLAEPGIPPFETVTDSNGSYSLDELPPGDYTATFSAPGYQSQSRLGTLGAGDDAQLSVTLEHSLLLSAMAAPPDGGVFLGYLPWAPLPDGGRTASDQLFYVDSSTLAVLVSDDGGSGTDPALEVLTLISGDGGLQFLGFDGEAGAVVEAIDASGTVSIAFADHETVSEISLGTGVSRVVSMGDAVFFAESATGQESAWSSFGRGDLAPTPLEQHVGNRSAPVALNGRMAGWSVGDAGDDVPIVFAPELSVPYDQVCTGAMTPLEASVDGERLAFAVFPGANVIWFGITTPTDPDQCTPSTDTEIFLIGNQVTQVADDTIGSARPQVYPLSDQSYAGEVPNADGTSHLFVHAAKSGGWSSEWEGDVQGFLPLHGSSLLAAVHADGGLGLEVIEGAGTSSAPGPTGMIPFEHEWSTPIVFSPDNRYVVFAGIGSLFDLEKLTEIPLVITPVFAEFDRLEMTALLVDANGQMATLSLGGSLAHGLPQSPQGTLLEGQAVAASFTPDETAIVDLGTDPAGIDGIFVQPVPQ